MRAGKCFSQLYISHLVFVTCVYLKYFLLVVCSLFLRVTHLDALARREQLELFHGDRLFAPKVPFDQIFKLTLGKVKSALLNQLSELIDADLFFFLLFDAVKNTLQKDVILLFVRELHHVFSVESSHQFAEFFLVDALAILGIFGQISDERIAETLVCICIVLVPYASHE